MAERRGRTGERDFDYFLRELRRVSFILRAVGIGLAMGTALAILWAPSAITQKRSSFGPLENENFWLWALLVGFNVALALLFESLKKRGDAIFEELSDEFQWHLGEGGEKRKLFNEIGPTRPPLELRVTLRSFLATADLPLAPGRFGPLLYSIINVVLFVLGAVIGWQQ